MSLFSDLFNLVFPSTCPVCGQLLLNHRQYVCPSCLVTMPLLHISNVEDNVMLRRLWSYEDFKAAFSLFHYIHGSAAHEVVVKFKYKQESDIAIAMGKWLGREAQQLGLQAYADVLVPIPMTPRKQRERGYNQAERLAKGISCIFGVPVVPMLKRTGECPPQASLTTEERWRNVQDNFTAEIPQQWRGKRIMLVDDVMTTGATIVHAAKALLQADATISMSVITLCMTPMRSS